MRLLLQFACLLMVSTLYAGDPILFDDFENGATLGWSKGQMADPQPGVEMGGPAGPSDRYLEYTSGVATGGGGKMVFFNDDHWAGNFLAGDYTHVEMDARNLSAVQTLYLRVAFRRGGSSWYAQPVVLPPNGSWQKVVYDIREEALLQSGALSYTATLGSVTQFRILSRQFGGGIEGDNISGTLGVDNIRAFTMVSPPAPEFSRIQFDAQTSALTFRWSSQDPLAYDLLYSNDPNGSFDPANWSSLTNGVPAGGATTVITLSDFQGQAWTDTAPWWAFRLRVQ